MTQASTTPSGDKVADSDPHGSKTNPQADAGAPEPVRPAPTFDLLPLSPEVRETLAEVARRRPHDLAALAGIPGIGATKLERYGAALLELLGAAV